MKHTCGMMLVCGSMLFGCEPSKLATQRVRMDELDRYLGTAQPLSAVGGVVADDAATAESTDADRTGQLGRIVSLLRTGTPEAVDLAHVRQATLENNLGLQSAMLAPEIATELLRAEQAKFQSTFTAAVSHQRTVSPQYYGSSDLIDVESDTLHVTPGLKVPLRTGGTVSLDWTMSTSEFKNRSGSQAFSSAKPTVGLEQPLLREAGFDYNEASIVLATANAGAQRGQAQLAVINQLIAAETGYWDVYLAWRTFQINVELYKTSRRLLDEQRELVDHGNGSIANVYNFEVSLAQSVDQVLAAERTLRLSIRALKVIMQDPDMSLDGAVAFKPSTAPRLIAYTFNPERLVAYALENRADLLELEYVQIQAAVDVMIKDNSVLAKLDFVGSYTFNGFASGQSLHSANSDLWTDHAPQGWMVGVNASVPIGNEIALSNYRASLLQRLQAIANVRNREVTVTSEVLDAIDTCETRWQQILTTKYQEKAAQRFFDAYQKLFSRGQIPSSNLTQALETLARSQVQAASAEVYYQIALGQLAQSAGCLLGHAGVEWGSYLDTSRLEASFPSPAMGLPDALTETLQEGGDPVETLSPDAGIDQHESNAAPK